MVTFVLAFCLAFLIGLVIRHGGLFRLLAFCVACVAYSSAYAQVASPTQEQGPYCAITYNAGSLLAGSLVDASNANPSVGSSAMQGPDCFAAVTAGPYYVTNGYWQGVLSQFASPPVAYVPLAATTATGSATVYTGSVTMFRHPVIVASSTNAQSNVTTWACECDTSQTVTVSYTVGDNKVVLSATGGASAVSANVYYAGQAQSSLNSVFLYGDPTLGTACTALSSNANPSLSVGLTNGLGSYNLGNIELYGITGAPTPIVTTQPTSTYNPNDNAQDTADALVGTAPSSSNPTVGVFNMAFQRAMTEVSSGNHPFVFVPTVAADPDMQSAYSDFLSICSTAGVDLSASGSGLPVLSAPTLANSQSGSFSPALAVPFEPSGGVVNWSAYTGNLGYSLVGMSGPGDLVLTVFQAINTVQITYSGIFGFVRGIDTILFSYMVLTWTVRQFAWAFGVVDSSTFELPGLTSAETVFEHGDRSARRR